MRLFTAFVGISTVLCVLECMYIPRKSLWKLIKQSNFLREFKEKIEVYNLVQYVEQEDITVFAPTSDSFLAYDSSIYGYDMEDPDTVRSVILNHIVRGRVRCTDYPTTVILQALLPNRTKLYLSHQYNNAGERICTVNGVRITATNTEASNGILHIVDRVISPIQSQKTIAEFLTKPDIPKLSFHSIYLASVVDTELSYDVNSSSSLHTIFAPMDVYINNMPDYGQVPLFQDTVLLKEVFWAHVVENKAFYIPDVGDIPQVDAKAGNLSFTRYNGQVYVYNNGVRARIVMTNIPLVNGVIHVIDNLLFYKYRSITQMVETLPEASVSATNLNQTNMQIKTVLRTSTKLTIFVPMNEAYAKLPFGQQEILNQNVTRLSEVFGGHIVQAVIYSDGLYDGASYYTIHGDELRIVRRNNDIYVEGGGVRAQIVIQNIGCTNGVIHVISNVLFVSNFTVWEAIRGLNMLSKMKEFISKSTDIQHILSYGPFSPITVFLTGDTALSMIAPDTLKNLEMNSNGLGDAIRGAIAKNVKLGTSLIHDSIEVGTYSGQKLNITKKVTGLIVTGTFIEANIIVRDIWCSNGVLHIVDNLLHVPTRNIVEELAKRIELSIVSSLLDALPEVLATLKSPGKDITFFVPSNEAFTDLPTEIADLLMKNVSLLITILNGHIVSGSAKLMDEFTAFESMQALTGKVYVIKKSGGVFVSINNVMGRINTGNVRCTNGVIHIIDRLLYFPYKTVEVTMKETPWLSKFYGLMSNMVEFVTFAGRAGIQQTVFAPSDTFLADVPSILQTIKTRPNILRETFRTHYVPDVNLGSKLLKDINVLDTIIVTSKYNVTFTVRRNPESIIKEDVVVDVGYPNLKQNLSLVVSGVACSNGIIYVIQGFFNYPMKTLLAEIYREKNLRISMDQLLKLVPENRSIDLNSQDDIWTVLAPVNQAVQFLSFEDIFYLNNNMSEEMMISPSLTVTEIAVHSEKHYDNLVQIIGRHFIRGAKYTLQYITDGQIDTYFSLHNMTVLKNSSGVFIVWQNIEAKVLRSNILATNGIIHVIDKILFTTPYEASTVTTTTQKGNISHVPSLFCVSYSVTNIALLLVIARAIKTL